MTEMVREEEAEIQPCLRERDTGERSGRAENDHGLEGDDMNGAEILKDALDGLKCVANLRRSALKVGAE